MSKTFTATISINEPATANVGDSFYFVLGTGKPAKIAFTVTRADACSFSYRRATWRERWRLWWAQR